VTLALAAPSRQAFVDLRTTILQTYPQVRAVYFWPVLTSQEGYYPGAWSDPTAIQRLTADAVDLPLLWDNELPRGTKTWREVSLQNWWANRTTLATFFAQHRQPIDIWRTHTSMGLNPAFLRLAALHFDPLDYPNLRLHLDLYSTGIGQDASEFTQIVRCGLERYGERFIPSLGVLDDGERPSATVLRRTAGPCRDRGAQRAERDDGEDDPEQALHGYPFLGKDLPHSGRYAASTVFVSGDSYNAGVGRISALRRKAKKMGFDENKWFQNVEVVVARDIGRETVQYVGNIYKYYVAYDLIVRQGLATEAAASPQH